MTDPFWPANELGEAGNGGILGEHGVVFDGTASLTTSKPYEKSVLIFYVRPA